jgi:hypothetical protein
VAAPRAAANLTAAPTYGLALNLLRQLPGHAAGRGLLLLLLAGILVLGSRYWRQQRRQLDVAVPIDLYLRLLRWAKRLDIHLHPSDTPYEQARRLGQLVPAGRVLIQTVIEGYVYFLFRRKGTTSAAPPPSNPEPANLLHSWRQLQPVLWQAWLQRFTRFRWQRKNQFHLEYHR